MAAFSSILEAGFSEEEKLRSLVEEIDTVILAADANNKIKQSCVHAGSGRSRNVRFHRFKDSSRRLPNLGPGGDRSL